MKLARVVSALSEKVKKDPESTAFVTEDKTWSYRQFDQLVQRAEQELVRLKVPSQVTVAVSAVKSVANVALCVALGQKGCTPLLISKDLGSEVKPHIYQKAAVCCELVISEVEGKVSVVGSWDFERAPHAEDDKDVALMLTTSGSTGVPKVVRLTQSGIDAFVNWSEEFFSLGNESKVLSYAPLNFDLSLLEVWAPLMLGACVIMVSQEKATQASYLKALVSRTQPNLIQGVPMLYTLLCQDSQAESSVYSPEHIVFTGDVTTKSLREQVAAYYPSSRFHNIYGCTETNDSFVFSADAIEINQLEVLPLGIPIQGSTFKIVNDEGFELNGAGEGELHTSTPFMSLGYTESDKTSQAFYFDEANNRWFYKSGDRVSVSDRGEISLIGRTDFIVKVRGVRTNLKDIEHVINLSQQVKESLVLAVRDEIAGSVLHAVVHCNSEQDFDGMSLRLLCAKHLPRTSIPSRFHVSKTSLPRTSTGKPDRTKIVHTLNL